VVSFPCVDLTLVSFLFGLLQQVIKNSLSSITDLAWEHEICCAGHCIDLMLEDSEKKILVHQNTIIKGRKITTYIYFRTSLISFLYHFTRGRDLLRPGLTHFATSYLTLGCLSAL